MTRRMLLGLVGVAACGSIAARPPGLQPDRHAEGRQLGPVAREYYLPEPPPLGGESPAPVPEPVAAADPDAIWALVLAAHDALVGELTMPLGTVPTEGM